MTKTDLTTEIKTAVNVLNALVKEANEQNIRVKITQEWHPMINHSATIGCDAPAGVQITETTIY